MIIVNYVFQISRITLRISNNLCCHNGMILRIPYSACSIIDS